MGRSTSRHGHVLFGGLLEALTQVLGTAKGYLIHHGPRVALLARELARDFDVPPRQQGEIFLAALLSDLGMIGLVEEPWERPVPILPVSARRLLHLHPLRGAQPLRALPFFDGVADLVASHHEWWDGSGYPEGLQGDQISFGAQILRIADTVCALGEPRPHRPAFSPGELRVTVVSGIGREFGPEVGRRMIRLLDREGPPPYDHGLFLKRRHRAIQDLLPEEVVPPSTGALLEVMGTLIDAKDPYTGGHSRRVAHLAAVTAGILGLDTRVQGSARAAGHLHDLGKLAIPLRLLTKTAVLEPSEIQRIRGHTTGGARTLTRIPLLRHLAAGARYHHERWDGQGYPEGLSREHIPIIPRILSVCDSYDAMTSARAYRNARTHRQAMVEIGDSSGSQFDPAIAEAFLAIPEETFRDLRRGRAALEEPERSGEGAQSEATSLDFPASA